MKNWTDSDKRRYQRSLSIPEQARTDLIDAVNDNYGKIRWLQSDLEFAFEVWNTYLAYSNDGMDINCGHCRHYVTLAMTKFVKLWQEKTAFEKQRTETTNSSTD